jgi:hypothetical protein
MGAPASCARCGRVLSPGEERRIPGLVAEGTAFAFAFFHGGMWAKETLNKPFCARCVRGVVGLAALAGALVLAAASAGLALWLRGPER